MSKRKHATGVEALDAIVAEMCDEMTAVHLMKATDLETLHSIQAGLRKLADRIVNAVYQAITEAATKAAADAVNLTDKKWRRQCGDAAAMREALEAISSAISVKGNVAMTKLSTFDIKRLAEAALAAPPRNCDVGTPEEQHERFAEFCKEVDDCAYCAIPGLTSGECALLWAGLPFGTKNNERSRQTCANCGTNHDSCETENCKRYGVCGNWTAAQEGGGHAN